MCLWYCIELATCCEEDVRALPNVWQCPPSDAAVASGLLLHIFDKHVPWIALVVWLACLSSPVARQYASGLAPVPEDRAAVEK